MMIRSDAVPIQMWLTDCDTFNEAQPFGVNHRCFCSIWECDDEIKDQFQDDPDQSFTLLLYDNEESLLDSIPYEETSPGVYFLSFIPSENTPGICDQQIKVQIRKEPGQQSVSLPALSTWANGGGPGDPWTTGSNPSFAIAPAGPNSEYLFVDYAFIPGVEYSFFINYNSTSVTLGCQIGLIVCDNLFNIQFSNGIDVIGSAGASSTDTITFVATASTTRIAIRVTFDGLSSTTVTLTSTVATRSVGTSSIIARSDCMNVLSEHEGSVLISYSNVRNYAGIINNNGSPDLTFHLRIPAVFFEERFPETDETRQLSNNRFISLNSQVEKQRLLSTDQMPFYMELKLKQVLKHQFVTIDGKDYVKREALEQVPVENKKWPLRALTCWLNEKEYVVRNIL